MAKTRESISAHEARFYTAAVAERNRWRTAAELANSAKISARTARKFTEEYTALGLIAQMSSWPAYMYQWSPSGSSQAVEYVARLQQAVKVLGL
jgi:Fic family protein